MYVGSSRVGMGLYERFGWRVMGGEEGKEFIFSSSWNILILKILRRSILTPICWQ
jgi:hypothetical protein